MSVGVGAGVGAGLSAFRPSGRSAFIASAFTYERGAPDVLTARISRAYKTSTGDTLTFVFQRDGVQVASVTSSQYASNDAPGARSGSGQSLSALTGALTVGNLYMITYEVSVNDSGATIFPFGLSPFEDLTGADFPSTVGWHTVFGVAKNTNTQAVVYTTGDITIPHFNVQDAQASIDVPASWVGDLVSYQITSGNETAAKRAFTVPSAGTVFVHPTNGSDDFGVGSQLSPYKSMSAAFAAIGDGVGGTIIKRPGFYDPYEVPIEGADGNPLRITHMPGERNLAIVLGDVDQHVARGGAGVAQNNATRDGIRIDGKSYVEIDGIAVHKVWRNGIFVKGAGADTVSGNIKITNCVTDDTGLSGIYICGDVAGSPVPANDAFRTRYVYVEDNDVTKTNTVNDWNYDQINSEGERGGVGEAITVANSVQYIYVRRNHVHNSRQYGIDFKNHVVDGEITHNRIDQVTRYAIYLDSGELDVRRILVANNQMSNCRAGLVLAREEDGNDSGDDLAMEDIDIVNNVTWNMSRVGMHFQRHPTKDQQNIGYFRRIRARFNAFFNTNTDGIYRDINIDDIASFGNNIAGDPIVSGIELIGNVAWNPDGSMRMAIDVAGDSRFTVAQNYNVQDGTFTGTDPLYVAPTADEPDFSLGDGSGAKEIVTTASYITAPFDKFPDGSARVTPGPAGAFDVFKPALRISSNVLTHNDFTPAVPFLNRFTLARYYFMGTGGADDIYCGDAALDGLSDSEGWIHSAPTGRTSARVFFAWSGFEPDYHQVSYDMTWDGAEQFTLFGVDNQTSVGTNHIRFTPRMEGWGFNITSFPGASGDYTRNVKIYRTVDASRIAAGEMFNPDYVALFEGLTEKRWMGWMGENKDQVVALPKFPFANYGSSGQDIRPTIPPEIIARFSNEVGITPWLNFHFRMTDAEISTWLERFVAVLDTDMVVKMAPSNETWNWGFPVHDYYIDAARALWSNVGPTDFAQDSYHGYKTVKLLEIAEDHLPRNRIKLVLETQSSSQAVTERRLEAQAWEDSGDTEFVRPGDVVDEIAATSYFGSKILSEEPNRSALLDAIDTRTKADAFDWLTSFILGDTSWGSGEWDATIESFEENNVIAVREGVPLTLYEGGQHVYHSFNVKDMTQAQIDILAPFLKDFVNSDQMGGLYQMLSDEWQKVSPSEPMMQFGMISMPGDFGFWGLLADYEQPLSPRAEYILGVARGESFTDYRPSLEPLTPRHLAVDVTSVSATTDGVSITYEGSPITNAAVDGGTATGAVMVGSELRNTEVNGFAGQTGNIVQVSSDQGYFILTLTAADAVTVFGATVTIPAQNSALSGFPVPIDLSEMDNAAWTRLRGDGGNLRAKSTDLATEYPIDVSFVDKANKAGRAWVRTDLSGSAATTFVLDVADPSVTAVASDAATGREAVWTGYAAAVSLPEKINRADGVALVEDRPITSGAEIRNYTQSAARQGIAYGSSGERFAFDTDTITKYASDWTTQTAINTTPLASQQAALNHVGDGCVVGTELFAANSKYVADGTPTSEVAVYETSNLTFKRSYNISSTPGMTALSSMCYNADDSVFYLSCFETNDEIFVFNSSFVQQASITLSDNIDNIQGITYAQDHIFVSHNTTGTDLITKVAKDGTVQETAATQNGYGQGIDITEEGYLVGVGSGKIIEWDISAGSMASGTVVYTIDDIGTHAGWTLSATSLNRLAASNQQIAGFNTVANTSTRGGFHVRSNGNYESWASGESWIAPSPATTRDAVNKRHMALTFNGTTGRDLFLDGDAYATDGPIGSTFTTSALNLVVGGNGASATSELFQGFVFDVLFHETVRSDEWIKAEADALLDPATFAVLTSR
jgi:hypothetical protein